jgi:uncharacterized protein
MSLFTMRPQAAPNSRPFRTLRGMVSLSVAGLAACGTAPRPAAVAAPAAPALAERPPAPAAPAALPFRLPCGDADVEGCRKGCAEKMTEDCVTLASMYMAGTLVEKDTARATSVFRSACNEGSARGCMRLGDAYHEGILQGGMDEIDAYKRACDAGANLGCVVAGQAYLSGRGVAADPVFAATLFKRVCERGNAAACYELAQQYKKGEGVPTDAARASQLFEKACKLGLDAGCLSAGKKGEVLSPRD